MLYFFLPRPASTPEDLPWPKKCGRVPTLVRDCSYSYPSPPFLRKTGHIGRSWTY